MRCSRGRSWGEIYKVAASDAVEMLKSHDYPREKWKFLLDLMNLFQLSFPLQEDGERQLCPTLLRAEPPPGTDEPQGADTVRLRYEFPVVPAPLLARFIVRTFSLIEQAKLWQRGAMLRYPGATARVWTTAEGEVCLRYRGRSRGRPHRPAVNHSQHAHGALRRISRPEGDGAAVVRRPVGAAPDAGEIRSAGAGVGGSDDGEVKRI